MELAAAAVLVVRKVVVEVAAVVVAPGEVKVEAPGEVLPALEVRHEDPAGRACRPALPL